ncbi:MAG: hypothetical protein AB7U81_13130 [Thiohalomonadaceae bacterium]
MNDDEELISKAIDNWNSRNTEELPSPKALEAASSRISDRTGRSKVILQRDAAGNPKLTAADVDALRKQVADTAQDESKIEADYTAIWNAVRDIYETKPEPADGN